MAKRSGSYTLGIVLVIVGGLMLLGQLGINIGWLIVLAIAGYLIFKGWDMYKHSESSGKRGFGIFLIVFGLLWITGLLPVIFGLAIAIVIIYFGWKLLKDKKQVTVATEPPFNNTFGQSTPHKTYQNVDHLDEWEREVNNRFKD